MRHEEYRTSWIQIVCHPSSISFPRFIHFLRSFWHLHPSTSAQSQRRKRLSAIFSPVPENEHRFGFNLYCYHNLDCFASTVSRIVSCSLMVGWFVVCWCVVPFEFLFFFVFLLFSVSQTYSFSYYCYSFSLSTEF